jgi:predicted SAM-dependent methyltransferase
MEKYKYLNLGCGMHYHRDWINVDTVAWGAGIEVCNLVNGIPFKDSSMDVVYHSHVLEHFSKSDAEFFMKECFRVLKKGGILRVAIPDLEKIATEYLTQLNNAVNGVPGADHNYEWIMLEMYDQTVRNVGGGEMGKFLLQQEIKNIDYVYSRIGLEGRGIREKYLVPEENNPTPGTISKVSFGKKMKYYFKPMTYLNFIKSRVFKKQMKLFDEQKTLLDMARFRTSGEIHQWMYDRYSLGELLKKCGFTKVEVTTAFGSRINNWSSFGLDVVNGEVRKPDSLYMEAEKK